MIDLTIYLDGKKIGMWLQVHHNKKFLGLDGLP